MQLAFSGFNHKQPISPATEMGAYEALWSEQGASFKKIAERFKSSPGSLPSNFVEPDRIEEYKSKTFELLDKAGIENLGIRVHGMFEYLDKLRDAKHPVELLYFQGTWDLVSLPSVAVVGTREPSDDGKLRTRELVRSLVKDGFTITSGLARGIDSVAHISALESGGRTMAVIGTPLTESYPKENRKLQDLLSNLFLVISQVPFVRYSEQTPPHNKWFFPERNKLMSAVTEATIIVEAGDRSGTLVQARAALEQKRKLFILETCFGGSKISWTEKFVSRGAIRVREYEDIRKHLKPSLIKNR